MVSEILSKIHFYLLVWDRLVIPPFWLILEVVGIAAALHALLNKRDPRAAFAWTAVCLLLPGIGALFYVVFGVNRIRSRAQDWHEKGKWEFSNKLKKDKSDSIINLHPCPFEKATFFSLVNISESVTRLPLAKGCRFEVLFNGEEAFPKMLEAIRNAKQWVFLATYIFETNRTGMEFIAALKEAKARGVDVRVLVDGIGSLYTRPTTKKILKKEGIPYSLFLPPSISPRSLHLNLRTHRKIMVADGKIGFTGGMNIGDRHLALDPNNPNPTQDIHFQVEGPILAQLQEAFLMDWHFSKNESRGAEYPCESNEVGEALVRGIIAGPNENHEKLRWIVNGAFTCAKKNIRIMTPYFIPDSEMTMALSTAAMRGVDIEIIMPEKNNLPYVKWASQALLDELMSYGIRFYYQPPPFAHSKFLVVDDFYCLIGSANLDPRSLILNFEFNLEVYDHGLADKLVEHFTFTRQKSKILSLANLAGRSFPVQLRDSVAKLFSPYL